jgi:adenylate cyclase
MPSDSVANIQISGCRVLSNTPGGKFLIDSEKMTALINWLVAGAPPKRNYTELVGEIGQRLAGTGIPVHQLGLYRVLLHPELPGQYNYWTARGGSRELTMTADEFQTYEGWAGSAGKVCMETERLVIHTLGRDPEFDANKAVRAQIKRGYTQFLFAPLQSHFSLAASVAGFGTKQAGGFTGEQQTALRRLQAPIARVIEAFVLHEGTLQILSTYVRRGAGERSFKGFEHPHKVYGITG